VIHKVRDDRAEFRANSKPTAPPWDRNLNGRENPQNPPKTRETQIKNQPENLLSIWAEFALSHSEARRY
jgi:hypothetical protein